MGTAWPRWLGQALVGLAFCVCGYPWALAQPTSPAMTEPAAGTLQLAWLGRDGAVHAAVLDARGGARPLPEAAARTVPLGSLWKLVVYAQLAESGPPEPDYVCRGSVRDEVYCCDAGRRVARGTALWRSCGLYFEPARIGWAGRAPGPTLQALPARLQALQRPQGLQSRQTVPLGAWLQWLADWAPATQQAARDDLLAYWTEGPGRPRVSAAGSRLRVKTFTLEREGDPGARWGGASGWLSDGRPVWMAARGSSKAVLPDWAGRALQHIDRSEARGPARGSLATPCVAVRYFARYPVARLLTATGTAVPVPAEPVRLAAGRYRAVFDPGNGLDIASEGELRWQRVGSGPRGQITAHLALDDYVARVVDREGRADRPAAARALAIAARTYVLAQGEARGGCLQIDDSSARQRVAPRPPTPAAREAADDTQDLTLDGSEGRYHHTDGRPDVLAWTDAVRMDRDGAGFAEILQSAYPSASLRTLQGREGAACAPLAGAQAWLTAQLPRWRRALQGEPGFLAVTPVQVCRLQMGLPHTQAHSRRIYVRGTRSLDERLTLAHEYLHLAFAGHPRGTEEAFIEQHARMLLGVD